MEATTLARARRSSATAAFSWPTLTSTWDFGARHELFIHSFNFCTTSFELTLLTVCFFSSHRFFQYTFSTTLSSIVAGAIAERTKMAAYLSYSIFLCGFVYPVCAHSFWSQNGFLSAFAQDPLWGNGVIDLAGSGPVHLCGGVAALVITVILGPRRGRFYDDNGNPLEKPQAMGPHSVTLQVSSDNSCRRMPSISHSYVFRIL
jgi:ammonia channel protein AmtB